MANAGKNDSKSDDNKELGAEDQKRLDKKAKRDAAKAKAAAEAAKAESKDKTKKAEEKPAGGDKKKVDEDPEGAKLAATETPLEDATKLIKDLLLYSSDVLATHLLAIEVYTKKNKFLLALRSLKKALILSPNDPSVHLQRISFLHAVEQNKASLSSVVAQVIDAERPTIVSEPNLSKLNDSYLAANKDSLPAQLACAKAKLLLDAKSKSAEDFITKSTVSASTNLQDCFATLEWLGSISRSDLLDDFKGKCHKQFPHTTAFFKDDSVRDAHYAKYMMPEPLSACKITNLA